MRSFLTVLFVVCTVVITSAQDTDQVKALEQRVRKLEERMATLEERIATTENRNVSSQRTLEAKKMEQVAQQHMQEERVNFKLKDIQKAEQLYVRASELQRDGEDCKALLDSVVSMYPQLNSAGCARLYRAQQAVGQEKELLLKDCMSRFSTCYYGDGAQVGPLAMLELAEYYKYSGREQEAKALYRKLRKEYSESVGHDGALLVDKI